MTAPARSQHEVGLQIRGLALQRGFRRLVTDFDLTCAPGDIIALQGPNGSGKTTLLRAIAGFHTPAAGRITLSHTQGAEVEEPGEVLSFLGHQDPIKAGEKLIDQLRFWADLCGASRDHVTETLARVGLTKQADLQGGVLSAGQRKRAALARLLLEDRAIWLLDEPASPLDQEGRALLGALLDQHAKQGGIILAAVHDPLPTVTARLLTLGTLETGVAA
ncbi:heme ABC exporter ATP-binding protein CcmA [Aquidulcibacter sp.]|uniref:heme ABC exporter ATP-binding protein CcmA n=1 Tax=Aquidulcibacter sp. TaxID=2052990 RepID=UPI0025B87859|nr:heme ABC exporter ATP-binding protein CcmA [Aquidulcibacter sp.]MCA3694607.1 heme ABC exporter ATP-binding protein CcmA [Aquidulcibacter sp.]